MVRATASDGPLPSPHPGLVGGRQRAFIFALSRCGSVARAARAVGMSPRSAYLLLDAPGADSFAEAWDRAIDEGVERVRADALQRALGGVFVPVFRRGKLVRVEHRQSDALAIALLNGQDKSIDDYRRNTASRRRKLRQDFAELDRLARKSSAARTRSGPSTRRSSTASSWSGC